MQRKSREKQLLDVSLSTPREGEIEKKATEEPEINMRDESSANELATRERPAK